MSKNKARPKRIPDEFYVLVKGDAVCEINWAAYGKNGVYLEEEPEEDDRVFKVREVLPKKRKAK